MANHKHRDIRYKGFIIGLDFDPGDYVGIESGWIYNICQESTGLDQGGSDSRMSFRAAVREAKETINGILTEADEYQEEIAEFAGNDEDYLRAEDDPCTEHDDLT